VDLPEAARRHLEAPVPHVVPHVVRRPHQTTVDEEALLTVRPFGCSAA